MSLKSFLGKAFKLGLRSYLTNAGHIKTPAKPQTVDEQLAAKDREIARLRRELDDTEYDLDKLKREQR